MDSETEALARERLDGELDEAGRRSLAEILERDPRSLAEFVDQVQIHHRLRETVGAGTALAAPVLREIRFQADSPRFSREVVDRLKGPRRRGLLAASIAAVLALSSVGFLLFSPAGLGSREALFVVGRVPLEPGDAPVALRLERLGFRVAARPAREVAKADLAGKALVVVSSTALAREVQFAPGQLSILFREAAVPVLTWEPRLFHDLGMIPGETHNADWATARNQTHLAIAAPGHPLAAGRSGRVRVSSAPEQLSWGRVRSDAIRIATLESDPARATIFAYDRGAAMPGRTAPARRAGFFLFNSTASSLTEDGSALLDAALRWCAGE